MSITQDTLALVADIFSNTERPDKITVTLEPVSHAMTVRFEDLDEDDYHEVLRELVATAPSKRTAGSVSAIPSRWRCSACGAPNGQDRQACWECSKSRAPYDEPIVDIPVPAPNDRRPSEANAKAGRKYRCTGCEKGLEDRDFEEWQCPSCGAPVEERVVNEQRSNEAPAERASIDRDTAAPADVQAAIAKAVSSGNGLDIMSGGKVSMAIAARQPLRDLDEEDEIRCRVEACSKMARTQVRGGNGWLPGYCDVHLHDLTNAQRVDKATSEPPYIGLRVISDRLGAIRIGGAVWGFDRIDWNAAAAFVEEVRALWPAGRTDYVLSAAEEEIDRRNIGREIPAPVALSSGEVCSVVRRVVDTASPETLPGALAAMSAIYDLVSRRGMRSDSPVVGPEPAVPSVSPIRPEPTAVPSPASRTAESNTGGTSAPPISTGTP